MEIDTSLLKSNHDRMSAMKDFKPALDHLETLIDGFDFDFDSVKAVFQTSNHLDVSLNFMDEAAYFILQLTTYTRKKDMGFACTLYFYKRRSYKTSKELKIRGSVDDVLNRCFMVIESGCKLERDIHSANEEAIDLLLSNGFEKFNGVFSKGDLRLVVHEGFICHAGSPAPLSIKKIMELAQNA